MAPDLAEATLQAVQMIVTEEARKRGNFGAEVKVPASASAQDKALAFAGRDPSWKA
jgi:hypothetical protein